MRRLQTGSKPLAEDLFPQPLGQNLLAAQLRTVARIIGAQQSLGLRRQVFYVELGGFDTHGDHLARHAALLTQLNDAMVYFDTLLGQLNMRDRVTLFTTSEFGRTFNSNGDGTDHGWASHHFVLGGGVKGGEIYGDLPAMDPNGPDFIEGGAMIPAASVEQYGATFAHWMAVRHRARRHLPASAPIPDPRPGLHETDDGAPRTAAARPNRLNPGASPRERPVRRPWRRDESGASSPHFKSLQVAVYETSYPLRRLQGLKRRQTIGFGRRFASVIAIGNLKRHRQRAVAVKRRARAQSHQ
jgi:hypothetical protein